MKVKCYVSNFIWIIVNYMVEISTSNYSLFANQFNQCDDRDLVIDTQLFCKMFLKCFLVFKFIWKEKN